VLVGGALKTMDPNRPTAEALAVRGGRIVAVGGDDEIRAHIGARTRVVELAGRSVTPGLADGHAHLYGLGVALESVSLRGIGSESEAAAVIAEAAVGRPVGEWITGRGWDQNLWSPQTFPTRAALDAVVPDHPVAVRRVDGHALWANSSALALTGVSASTPDPSGGRILRDASGEPTGVLVDNAMDLIDAHLPSATADVRERRILAAAQVAIAHGLTAVHEMGIDQETTAVYRSLADAGRLPLRIHGLASYEALGTEGLRAQAPLVDDGDDFFALRAVKAFADGALGSRGAALLAPYSDDPSNVGLLLTSGDDLVHIAEVAAEHGWQLAVHAIGDRANRLVLDTYEQVMDRRPGRDLRFRIEHAQVLAAEDIPRFGRLGVLASMQPTHCTSDMPWATDRVGPERARGAYAWRKLLMSDARIVAGSDFPVEEVSPLLGVYAAITRQDAHGQPADGWHPDQRLTLDEAIGAFTIEPAFAAFVETQRGRLAPGYVADITVFDRRLVADATLLQTRVSLTIVNGQIVYEPR
jgi:predicted amidohydrolase YtcJ